MSDLLLICPKCGEEQWFENSEYSLDHIIITCGGCGVRLYSELKFVEEAQ